VAKPNTSDSTQPEPAPTASARSRKKIWVAAALLGIGAVGAAYFLWERTDIVFEIRFVRFANDKFPVIEIRPNGQPRPAGTGPFGDYFLILRDGRNVPFTRQFDTQQAESGVTLDFLVDREELRKTGSATVAVENVVSGSAQNTIRLSNRISIPLE
jgi:hypothetical protein